MKKLIMLLSLLGMVVTASATDYDKLWKAVDKSQQNDKPRTTMTLLQGIIKQAEKDKAYGEYLAAQIRYANMEVSITPDSLEHEIAKLKTECEKTKDPVQKAVMYAVLAHSDKEHAKEYYDKALTDADLLAATDASAYKRIVTSGTDDEVFNNDLLSVIGNTANRYGYLKDYYLEHGNRRAACIELYHEIRSLNSSNDDLSRTHRMQMIEQGMKDYADVDECALLAMSYYGEIVNDEDVSDATRYAYINKCIEKYGKTAYAGYFNNRLTNLTNAKVSVRIDDQITCDVRNVKGLKLEFWALKADGTTNLDVKKKEGLKAAQKLVDGDVKATVMRTYDKPAWEEVCDTIAMPDLTTGVYLVKATADDLSSYDVLYHSDIAVLHQPLGEKNKRLVVVSAKTGMPLGGAEIVLTDENTYKKEVKQKLVLKCNSKGEATFDGSFDPDYLYVSTATDKAFRKAVYNNFFNLQDRREKRDIINVLTDRAIYRPGQKLQGTVIVHNAMDEESIHSVANKKVVVRLYNTGYEEVFKDSVVTDEWGNAGFEMTIPQGGRNGKYTVDCVADDACSGHTFVSVEEYKRPTFEVSADDSLGMKTYKQGDKVKVTFHAETLTKLPVQNAEVVYSVKRNSQWFWYCYRHGGDSRNIVVNDTLRTDEKGDVTIPLDIMLPEEGYGRFAFVVTAKVTDAAGETHEESVSLYARRADERYADTKPESEPVFKLDADAFPRDGKGVKLTVKPESEGAQLPVYLVYTLRAGDKVLEQSAVVVKDKSYVREFKYDKKKQGNGLTVSYAFVRDGKIQEFSRTILKPRPDLKLKTTWSTFRDRTQPGKEEKWTLRVENGKWRMENGKAGGAALSATVYDKSLDLLSKLSWSLSVLRNNYSVYCPWRYAVNSGMKDGISRRVKMDKERGNSLAYISEGINPYYGSRVFDCVETMSSYRKAPLMAKAMADVEDVRIRGNAVNDNVAAEVEKEIDLSKAVRSNLGETAYFTPSLVADKDGSLNITFTMPETMTTWRFLGLVHDAQMRYDIIDTTCVATKNIIVKPNAPRFLRENDVPVLSATVSNTTDKALTADVVMQFVDPKTEKALWQKTEKVTVDANSTEAVSIAAVALNGALAEDSVLIYRVVAMTSDGTSDGEQHIIPVMPEMQMVTTTVAFTQHEPGVYSKDLSDLLYKGSKNRRLTVQYVEHAVQMILDAVPTTLKAEHDDALCLASAAYVMNLFNIADTAKVEERLRKLQNGDGSWSWWNGMEGSAYITTAVSKLLARLQSQGHGTAATDKMLSAAMPYMMKYISEEAKNLRELQKKYPKMRLEPSDLAIDVLYVSAISDARGKSAADKDVKYLVGLLEKVPARLTIYGKAHSAAVLALYGKTKKAGEFLESMKEYSVCTEEAGRYYDTNKAYYSWRNYRIPTEVAAMEAIRLVTPNDEKTIEEMQRWLLHEKRTQRWDTSVNTADAIYAFCLDNKELKAYEEGKKNGTIAEGPAMKKEVVELPADNVFRHEKTSAGTSWGALYVEQMAPLSAITSQGSGFSVNREVIGGEHAVVGDKVTVRITIKADRDYDLVSLSDNRSACLEPVNQKSGYCYVENRGSAYGSYSGCYREVKNNVTNYYFNRLSKGTHVVETEYFVDRMGAYSQGLCTVRCEYAPEFSGVYNTGDKMKVK